MESFQKTKNPKDYRKRLVTEEVSKSTKISANKKPMCERIGSISAAAQLICVRQKAKEDATGKKFL